MTNHSASHTQHVSISQRPLSSDVSHCAVRSSPLHALALSQIQTNKHTHIGMKCVFRAKAALNQSHERDNSGRIVCNNVLCCVNLPRIVLGNIDVGVKKTNRDTCLFLLLCCAERVP